MNIRPLILAVDDDAHILQIIKWELTSQGCQVITCRSGEEALDLARDQRPDLVVLDVMMPSINGLEVLRRLRERSSVPVLLLTARNRDQDKIGALDTGADDYVTKPFSPEELSARVKAVLRRSNPELSSELLTFEDLAMDLADHRVRRNGQDIHLGPTEFRLLRHLMQHPGRVFTREQLLDSVWGRDVYVEPRTVDVHIRRLRKALNQSGENDLIRTVRSAGYALDRPSA